MQRFLTRIAIQRLTAVFMMIAGAGLTPTLCAQQKVQSPKVMEPFGMVSHWNEAKLFALAKQVGVQWLRIDISWYHVQPKGPEHWQWDRIDYALDQADRLGLKVLAILSYSTRWSTSGDPKSSRYMRYAHQEQHDSAYQAFIRTVVDRYVDKVSAWEIMNEPDHYGFLKLGSNTWAQNHHPDQSHDMQRRLQYQHMINLAKDALQNQRKQILLTTSGLAIGGNCDMQFVNWLAEQDGFFKSYDVLNFHKYGYPKHTSLIDGIENILRIKKLKELSVPLWVTEHGINRHSPDTPPADAQSFFIKSYAIAMRMGVEKLFWYRLHKGGGSHVSLLKSHNKPSVIFPAYQQLTTHWQNPVSFTALTGMPPSLDGAIAQRADGKRVAIVWLNDPNADPIALTELQVSQAPILEAYNLQGQAIDLQSHPTLTTEPVFIYLQP